MIDRVLKEVECLSYWKYSLGTVAGFKSADVTVREVISLRGRTGSWVLKGVRILVL